MVASRFFLQFLAALFTARALHAVITDDGKIAGNIVNAGRRLELAQAFVLYAHIKLHNLWLMAILQICFQGHYASFALFSIARTERYNVL